MFVKKKLVNINIKLLTGLDNVEGYDPERGTDMQVQEGIKLKDVVKKLDLPFDQPISYIINGEKAKISARLKEGDEVFCFLPFGGG